MRAMTLSLLAVLAAMGAGAAPPSTDFKGLVLGAPLSAERLKDDLQARCFEDADRITTCTGFTTIAEAESEFRMVIRPDGTLGSVTLRFKEADYATVRRAMTQKFGQPSRIIPSTVKTAGGATLSSEDLIWSRPDGASVVAIRRLSVIDRSMVSYSSAAQVADDNEAAAARRRNQVRDL